MLKHPWLVREMFSSHLIGLSCLCNSLWTHTVREDGIGSTNSFELKTQEPEGLGKGQNHTAPQRHSGRPPENRLSPVSVHALHHYFSSPTNGTRKSKPGTLSTNELYINDLRNAFVSLARWQRQTLAPSGNKRPGEWLKTTLSTCKGTSLKGRMIGQYLLSQCQAPQCTEC